MPAVVLRAGPSERLAGLAFLLFTVMQVPYLAIHNTTIKGWSTMVLLSPLQITAAKVASQFPQAETAAEAALMPGAWVREALSPLIICKVTAGADCSREQRLLFDFDRVKRRIQLPSLIKLIDSPDFRSADALTYGAALITLSSLLAVVVTVKTSIAGFLLMGLGIVQGAHQPMPPAILVAFLCIYSGFGLGEGAERRRAAREQQRQGHRRAHKRDEAGGGAGSSGGNDASQGKAKDTRAKARRA